MPTNNRGYNLPSAGDSNWDTPLNSNFESIDVDVQDLFDNKASTSHDNTAHSVNFLDSLPLLDGGTSVNSFTSVDFGQYLGVTDNTDGSATIDVTRDFSADILSTYLTTTQSTTETGVNLNIFENVRENDFPYTINSNSQITFDEAGRYLVNWSVTWQQVGGSGRTTMKTLLSKNSTDLMAETASTVYIRLANGAGDTSGTSNSTVINVSAGDTLNVRSTEHTATGYDHDCIYANCSIEKLD